MNFKLLPSFITFRNLSIACAVLLVIRLIFVVMTHHKIHSAEDFLIAQNLVGGYGYTFDTNVGATALKAPVYPLFLAMCVAAFGTYAQLAAALLQHCAIAFVPLLLARLGRVWNIEFLGCLSGFLFLLHPSYFYYPNVLEVTNLFIPLFLIWGILSTRLWQRKEKKTALQWGILSGILILTQPLAMPFVMAVMGGMLYRRTYHILTISLLSCMIVFTPWITRNYLTFHKIVPTKSAFWMNFYVGWLPQNHGRAEFNLLPEGERAAIDSLEVITNDVELEQHYKTATLALWKNHPILTVQKFLYQAGMYWWVPVRYQQDTSIEFLVIRKLPVVFMSVFWCLGMVFLFRQHRRIAWLSIAALGYFTVVYGMTHTANIRFKLDIEWIELFAIAALWEFLLLRRNSSTLQKDTAL